MYVALQQIEKEQAQAKTEAISSCSKKQLTVAQVLESRKLYAFDHPRAQVQMCVYHLVHMVSVLVSVSVSA